MQNFWQQLKTPVFCLAPMEEVTDFAFREMFARYSSVSLRGSAAAVSAGSRRPESDRRGDQSNLITDNKIASSPDKALAPRNDTYNDFVMFTEFMNVDGLLHPEGFEKLKIDLKYSEVQRPIIAQIWGRDPEKFFKVAQMLVKMGFDGIDINFGCPQAKEIAGGTCAALIREPKLAQEIIAATKKGAGDLPVSVKTRLAYSKLDEMEAWVKNLLEMNLPALTLHARTKQEMSKVPAHWDKITEAVKIRDMMHEAGNMKRKTLIIGNGDIKSRDEGLARIAETKCDGVMIARGAFGNPWMFRADGYAPDIKERFRVMLEHAELFNSELGKYKSFAIMRKHFKAYCSGFNGAAELRAKLMETKNLEETKSIVSDYLRDNDLE